MIHTIFQVLLGQEATTSALKSSITPEYLAPIFTFIVGLLGIIGQISVSYFTEKRKYTLEYSKIKSKNVFDFYVPLLVLIRQYKCYRKILLKFPTFTVLSKVNLGDDDGNAVLQNFIELYDQIFDTLKKNYIPTNGLLDAELNNLMEHVIEVQCIRKNHFDDKLCMEIVQKKYIRGYECDAIEQLLVAEITKTSGSKYLVSSKKAGTF